MCSNGSCAIKLYAYKYVMETLKLVRTHQLRFILAQIGQVTAVVGAGKIQSRVPINRPNIIFQSIMHLGAI